MELALTSDRCNKPRLVCPPKPLRGGHRLTTVRRNLGALAGRMKAILFDLDETLLDRKQSLIAFVSNQAKSLVADSEIDRFIQRFIELDSNGSVWKDIVYSKLVDEFGLVGVNSDFLLNDYVDNFHKFCIAKPGAKEAVASLHGNGFLIGLVSNGKTPFQERAFDALDLSNLFSTILVSEAVGYRKPDPDIFNLACNNLGVLPSETIFVGDNPIADIEGAKAVGMYTIYIPGFYGPDCIDSDAVCNDFHDLSRLVQNAC